MATIAIRTTEEMGLTPVEADRLYDMMIKMEMERAKGRKARYAEMENEMVKKTEEIQKRANDRQVAGVHYKNKSVQPWDVIDGLPHAQAIGFYRGNAIKYIMRAGDKGPAREDYEKAIHYIEKLLEIL